MIFELRLVPVSGPCTNHTPCVYASASNQVVDSVISAQGCAFSFEHVWFLYACIGETGLRHSKPVRWGCLPNADEPGSTSTAVLHGSYPKRGFSEIGSSHNPV